MIKYTWKFAKGKERITKEVVKQIIEVTTYEAKQEFTTFIGFCTCQPHFNEYILRIKNENVN